MKLTEADIIADHAFQSEPTLQMAVKVGLAFPKIKERIEKKFLGILISQLEAHLGQKWKVADLWHESDCCIAAYKPPWGNNASIGLSYLKTGPSDLCFYVWRSTTGKKSISTALKQALDAQCGHGRCDAESPWWRYVDVPYRDLNTEDALIGLWEKHQAVEYFTNHLLKICKIASPFLDKLCGK